MKLNHQTQYFINGVILIVIGLLCVTIFPQIVREKISFFAVANYTYYQAEFFTLCAAAIFFLFSPKYYKEQILTILLGLIYYILFVKLYN